MFVNDFDLNGFKEQIICYEIGGKNYPMLDKDELIAQLPAIKKKIVYYKDYSNLSIDQIFDKETIKTSEVLNLNTSEIKGGTDIPSSSKIFMNVSGNLASIISKV